MEVELAGGTFPKRANFDRAFYVQSTWVGEGVVVRETSGVVEQFMDGRDSTYPRGLRSTTSSMLAKDHVDTVRARGLVSPDRPLLVTGLGGRRRNVDSIIGGPRPGVRVL